MNKKILAFAGCIVTVAPPVSMANVIPDNLIGLNLGEIRSSSFLNQPFKGVIPFLFSSFENSKKINISLAPESVFNEVGAYKDPILDNLVFQVIKQNNKPVIMISSEKPINLPFLSFILEVQGPDGSVYQDYTVLLDPESTQISNSSKDEVSWVNLTNTLEKNNQKEVVYKSDEIIKNDESLMLANSSNTIASDNQTLKYTVKSGDSLSKIAQKQKSKNTSVKMMSYLIHQKNPRAFIRGDANRIKKGAILNLPTTTEINNVELAEIKQNSLDSKKIQNDEVSKVGKSNLADTKKVSKSNVNVLAYTVLKGDSLSKITKKFVTKDTSFTKLMSSIYTNNPSAFSNKSKNSLKAGVELIIPNITESQLVSGKISEAKTIKTVDTKAKQYEIKEGDTLSYITKNIGYSEVPFAKMLKAIYVNNPDAFIDGKMTKLSVGSILTIPPLNGLERIPSSIKTISKTTSATEIKNEQQSSKIKNTNAAPTDLVKRIRELRKELQQSNNNLSELMDVLNQKETLLQQKNKKIDSLNTILTKFERNIEPELLTSVAIKTMLETESLKDEDYKPMALAGFAKVQKDFLDKEEETLIQLEEIEELRSNIAEPNLLLSGQQRQAYFKEYPTSSSLNLTNTNYYYLTMALVLGLLLIRYRRELYSYTYSVINFDQPSYYPLQDSDKYELKEVNISFHDPKMDKDEGSYELMAEIGNEEKVEINPLLVEATEDIFEPSEEDKEVLEINEELLNDLLDDLTENKSSNEIGKSEEEVRETIESNIDPEIQDLLDLNPAKPESKTALDENMPFLLKGFDNAEISKNDSSKRRENFPELL